MYGFLLKKLAVAMLLLASAGAFAQNRRLTVGDAGDVPNQSTLVSQNNEAITVRFNTNGLDLKEVDTGYGKAFTVNSGNAPWMVEEGAPELPYLTATLAVPDEGALELEVIAGDAFVDFEDIEIAPSKGSLKRSVDPQTIPYRKGEVYNRNMFYPERLASMREPFILRDARGVSVDVFPVQYNPVTKVLRVYPEITISVRKTGGNGVNEIKNRKRNRPAVREFNDAYRHQFINFVPGSSKAYPLEEAGELLVICHDAFMDAMQPYVEWKRTTGRATTIVPTSETGKTSDAIKNYITAYYNSDDHNLTYVLLVGDHAQIPVKTTTSGDTDNWYGYLAGNDSYNEVFVGRFSAENVAHVETQVQRTIHYERDIATTDTWLSTGIGIARNEGAGNGHNGGEADYRHMNIIRDTLLNYTYTQVYQEYDQNCPGVANTSASQMMQRFNAGAGITNFTNHGSETGWSVGNFSKSHVNQLTNTGKLPFILSTACLNGNFRNYTCFAETWLRATRNGEPTGAIATIMATITQLWQPPMTGQDEMIMLLTENRQQTMRTFAGVAVNGSMKAISVHGGYGGGKETHDTWIVFGDPSLMLRTAAPQAMDVSHIPVLFTGMDALTVNCDANGALAAVTRKTSDGETLILGTATVENGIAQINFDAPLFITGNLTLAITGFNRVTHIDTLEVVPANAPFITMPSYSLTGDASYGTTAGINIELKNISNAPYTAHNVTVEATTDNPYIQLPQSLITVDSIEAGEVLMLSGKLQAVIADTVPDGEKVVVHITINAEHSSETYSWKYDISFTASAPRFRISKVFVETAAGLPLNYINPKQENLLKVQLTNDGHASLFNINAAVQLVSQYVAINGNSATVDTLKAGETIDVTFPIAIIGTPITGTPADIVVRASAGLFASENIQTITIGRPVNYFMAPGELPVSYSKFYDSGGDSRPYSKNENYTLVFNPETEGAMLTVSFTMFNTEQDGDHLSIYNGPHAADSLLLATLSGDSIPAGSYEATNEAGVLTVVFTSTSTVEKDGWEAIIREKHTWNSVQFNITANGETAAGALIVFDGYTLARNQTQVSHVASGRYHYSVSLEGFEVYSDSVDVYSDEDIAVQLTAVSIEQDAPVPESIRAYPNPFTGTIYIDDAAFPVKTVHIANMQGVRIRSIELDGASMLPAGDLPSGIYLITFEGYDHRCSSVRMIKR